MVIVEARAGTARRHDYEANHHHYHHSMRSKQRQASGNRRRNVELAMHLSYLRDSTIQLPAHNILDATAKYLIVAVLGIIQDKVSLAPFCVNDKITIVSLWLCINKYAGRYGTAFLFCVIVQ